MDTCSKVTYLSPSDSVCPICGSRNIQSISRITGYLSLDERFGPGKCEERSLRVDHNDKHQQIYKR
jgi:ribonucleoside-triphosphate reductase